MIEREPSDIPLYLGEDLVLYFTRSQALAMQDYLLDEVEKSIGREEFRIQGPLN